MMRWAYPWMGFLPALTLLFGIGCLWAVGLRRRDLLKVVSDPRISQSLWEGVSWNRKYLKSIGLALAALFLSLALMGPQWGYREHEVRRKGMDLVIAIDVSKSMLAEDIKPSRLGAVQREVKGLIDTLKGDRVAIAAFAGTAFLQCPLTGDYGTAKLFVDELSPGVLPLGGTNITAAIRESLAAFEGHEKKSRGMILITDGEDHEGDLAAVLEEVKKEGVRVFPVGVGKLEGVPIPLGLEEGAGRFLKDSEGRVVITKRDDATLKKIAEATGGRVAHIGAGDFLLEDLYKQEISRFEKKNLGSVHQRRYEPRFALFVWMALILYLAAIAIPEKRGGGRS